MNLRVRSVTCWSDMVVTVDEIKDDQQLSVCRLDDALLVVVVKAVEEDLAALNCGSEFTSAIFFH